MFLNRSGFVKLFSQETTDFSPGSMFYIAYLYVVLSANVKSMGRKKGMDL